MRDEQTVTDVIDLAEGILREVTRASQDWRAAEHMATALAKLAAGASRVTDDSSDQADGSNW